MKPPPAPPSSPDAGGSTPEAGTSEDGEDGGPEPLDAAPEPSCPMPLEVTGVPKVYPVYLRASDTTTSVAAKRRDALDCVMAGIQRWYSNHMGAKHGFKTFALAPAVVIKSKWTKAEWGKFDPSCGMYHACYEELVTDGKAKANGIPPPEKAIIISVGGGGTAGSCGAQIAEGGFFGTELQTLTDSVKNCPNGDQDSLASDCAAPGVMAHELGHTFGMPHSDERPCTGRPSVMYEWWDYGTKAGLCVEERADLAKSSYFAEP